MADMVRQPRSARNEKTLTTEPGAICICSACASLTLPLAEELLFDMYHSHRAASHEENREAKEEGGRGGGGRQEKGGAGEQGVGQSQRMTSGGQSRF